MSTPHTPDGAPADTGPGAEAAVPVNVAKPNWACPHCHTKHGTDYDRAVECAQAGAAPEVTAGEPVIVLNHGSGHTRFGLTEVGAVRRVFDEDGVPQHVRDVTVAGKALNAEDVATAPRNRAGVAFVGSAKGGSTPTGIPELDGYGLVSRMFGAGYGSSRLAGGRAKIWASTTRHDRGTHHWWRQPTAAEREVLNMIWGGMLDHIAEADDEQFRTSARYAYTESRGRRPSARQPSALAGPDNGFVLAEVYGAPNDIWALRWLGHHFEEILEWQITALKAWASPTPGAAPIPGAVIPAPAEELPKNPGKRREALMEPYGNYYRPARDAVLDLLRAPAPTHPIPGVADVETTVRHLAKGTPA